MFRFDMGYFGQKQLPDLRTLVNCYSLQALTCVNPDFSDKIQDLDKTRRCLLRQNSDYSCRLCARFQIGVFVTPRP